jgi:poly(3-hydroxybutyrate) depolymerase
MSKVILAIGSTLIVGVGLACGNAGMARGGGGGSGPGSMGAAGQAGAAAGQPDAAGTAGATGAGGGAGATGAGGGAGAAGGSAGGAEAASDGAGGFDGDADAMTAAGGSDGAPDGGADASVRASTGCGRALGADDVVAKLVARTVHVAGLADVYLPGGTFAQSSGGFDLSNRPFAIRLPADYNPTQPLAVTFEGGGCGEPVASFVSAPFSEFVVDPKHNAIEVVLAYVNNCFLDGGPAIGDRDDSPEVPYFRAVLADVEARFCVDTSRVFVTGSSSGAWEAELLGCAAADVVRGIAAYGGGLRAHRPACRGPVAAALVVPTNDLNDPVGPLAPTDPFFISHDSPGQLPLRDELLARNGCVGSTMEPWDSAFPACVRFSDCPAAFPVVWCPIVSAPQFPGSFEGVRYLPGVMWPFLSALSPP